MLNAAICPRKVAKWSDDGEMYRDDGMLKEEEEAEDGDAIGYDETLC